MRILFVGNGIIQSDKYPNPDVGGSVQTWGLCRELAKCGHEVIIIRRSSLKYISVDNVQLVGCDLFGIDNLKIPFWSYPYHLGSIITKIYFSKKALKAIEEIKPDIICMIDRFTALLPSKINCPKIFIMHVPEALDVFRSQGIQGNKLNALMFEIKKTFEQSVIKNSNKIIVLNTFLEQYLYQKNKNVQYISNGVEIDTFSNKGDKNYILYAGRFDWNKNVSSLVEVFSNVTAQFPEYDLYLVGSGPAGGEINSLVAKNKLSSKVKIIPWVSRNKLAELMSDCSFFVLPSFYEACPVVLLEAMASGKPVIARHNMGSFDLVRDGITGFLYKDDQEFEKYVKLLLKKPELRTQLGSSARLLAENKYSFSKISAIYLKLFQQLEMALDE